MAQHRRRAWSMPVFVALCLTAACFMLGYQSQSFLQRGSPHGAMQQHGRQLQQDGPSDASLPRHLRVSDSTANIPRVLGLANASPTSTLDIVSAHIPADGIAWDEQEVLQQTGLLHARPPVPTGASGEAFVRVLPLQILSWAPRLLVFPAFISPERCNSILKQARGKVLQPGSSPPSATGAVLDPTDDPDGVLSWLESRIAAAALLHPSYAGPFQLIQYQPDSPTADPGAVAVMDVGPEFQSARRVATGLVVLSSSQQGGELVFKREGVGNASVPVHHWSSSDDGQGLVYKPRQGDMLLYYNAHPDGRPDVQAAFGHCQLRFGEQQILVKLMYDKPVQHSIHSPPTADAV